MFFLWNHNVDDDDQQVQNARNQSGYVPSNYVKKEKPSIFDSIKKKVKKGGSFSKTLPSSAGGSPVREFDSPLPNRSYLITCTEFYRVYRRFQWMSHKGSGTKPP